MSHSDENLRRWAMDAHPDALRWLLAPTVLRMALLVTGKRYTRRDFAEAAILAARAAQ